MLFGIVALLVGPMQFSAALRRHRNWHRTIGFVYLFAIALSSVCGLSIAPTTHGGLANAAAFTILNLLWVSSTAMAWISIRRRDIGAHQRWMMRSYAVTFAAVTLRVELGLLIGLFGLSFDQAYAIVPWTCWGLNLVLLEWCILPKVMPRSS